MYVSKYISEFEVQGNNVLLVNALTGAVDVATPDLMRILRETPSALPGDTLASLRKRGYLLPSEAEEQCLLEKLAEEARSLRRGKRPREYIICPTYDCNLSCSYCFERTIERRPKVMADAEIDALFRAVDALLPQEERPPVLQLFGGEPLLPGTKAAVARIFEEGRRRGLRTNIVTNGVNVLAFSDLIETFAESIVSFQITIDGPPEVHDLRRKRPGSTNTGTFAQMMDATDYLVTHGHKIMLRVNVDRQNVDRLPALADRIVERGWQDADNFRCGAVPVQNHTGDTRYPYYMREDEVVAAIARLFGEHAGLDRVIGFDYYRLVNRIAHALRAGGTEYSGPSFHSCEACMGDYYVFGVDGYIYPCPEAIAQPRFAIGSFLPQLDLDETRAAAWRDRSALKISKCRECEIISFCAGGCAYAALYAHGDMFEPVCGDAKLVLAEYVKYAVAKHLPPATGGRSPVA